VIFCLAVTSLVQDPVDGDSTIDLSVFREGVKPYEDEGIMDRKIKKNNEDVIPYFSCFWIIKMNRRIL